MIEGHIERGPSGIVRGSTVYWDRPKKIWGLPQNDPDFLAKSPDHAKEIMERRGLVNHPLDESGTSSPLGTAQVPKTTKVAPIQVVPE